LILWTLLVLLPVWMIFGAADDGSQTSRDLVSQDAAGPPGDFPSWRKAFDERIVEIFACDHANDGYRYEPTCRGRSGCTINALTPLHRGEVVRHQSSDMPAGSVVELQIHEQHWLVDDWATVASAPLSAGHDAVTRAPYSGWYRLRVTVPGVDATARWYCATVKR
jgi:hypothetical protein